MKKIYQTNAFLALVLWILGGSIFVYQLTSKFDTSNSLFANPSSVILKDGNFEVKVSQPIQFAPRQSSINLSRETTEALVDIADHLINDPSKKLLVTGHYTLTEENESEAKGVGNERAENMKALLVTFGADPSSIYTTAKLNPAEREGDGVTFEITDKNKKVNTNPLLERLDDKLILQYAYLLPYYTRSFDQLDVITNDLNELIERVVAAPDLSLVLLADSDDKASRALVGALAEYIEALTYGMEIMIIQEFEKYDSVSDRAEHNIRIDIGIKRFQNNSEFYGS